MQNKLKRLAAMTACELFNRCLQAAHDAYEYHRYVCRGDSMRILKVSSPLSSARLFHLRDLIDGASLQEFYARSPHALDKLIERADAAVQRRFTILGLEIAFEKEVDWHYDPLARKTLPLKFGRRIDYYSSSVVKEVRYVWELNRCRHFVTLAEAWCVTGRKEYAEALVDQWCDWLAKNPYPLGINWASALECALRLIAWTWSLMLAQDAPHFTDRLVSVLFESVERHLHFIERRLSYGSSANNHLIGEAVGLIYAGFYAPVLPAADRLCRRGFRLFRRHFPRQVFDDGVAEEQSVAYQAYLIEYGLAALSAAGIFDQPMAYDLLPLLRRMGKFLRAISDGSAVPNIGDEDGGAALPFFEPPVSPLRVLSLLEEIFQPRDSRTDRAAYWLFPRSPAGGKEWESKEEKAVAIFPQGGYAVITNRFGPHSAKLVLDGGPLGLGKLAAHGHADFLGIWLMVDGRPVLIDAGTFLYLGAGPERNWFRSARAHNTLVVDGREPAEPLGPFQWGKRPAASLAIDSLPELRCRAEHNGYRPIRLTRSVAPVDDGFVVKDCIDGVGIHQADAYFHLAPSCAEQAGYELSCRFDDFCLLFRFQASAAMKVEIEHAPFSPRFGERAEHPVIHLSVSGSLPLVVKTQIQIHGKTL